jgi:hypothetical protein
MIIGSTASMRWTAMNMATAVIRPTMAILNSRFGNDFGSSGLPLIGLPLELAQCPPHNPGGLPLSSLDEPPEVYGMKPNSHLSHGPPKIWTAQGDSRCDIEPTRDRTIPGRTSHVSCTTSEDSTG